MTDLIQSVKNNFSVHLKSLYKAAISLLAVMFLFVSTGCDGTQTNTKINPPGSTDNMPTTGKITELYKPIAPPEGGMNTYSDVDPRQDTSEANAKAQREIDKTAALQKGDTNPFEQIRKQFDNKGVAERAKDFSKDASNAAKENAQDFARGTERGVENIKKNSQQFKTDVEESVDKFGNSIRDKATDNM
jgi:hypothetical protein